MIFWNTLRTWVPQHKILSGLLIILALVLGLGLLASVTLVSLNSSRSSTSFQPLSTGSGLSFGFGGRQGIESEGYTEPASGAEIEVKEASFTIHSEDAEGEAKTVREISTSYDGYIERSNKSETNTVLRITMTARVPTDRFDQFTDALQQNFDVENYTIKNYRIPIQRTLDELDILRRALDDYSQIREEVHAMPIGQEKINLLMNVTNKELELKQKEKTFERDLSGKQRQGELATVVVSLEQKLKAELWPENIGNKFRDGFKQALESALDSIVSSSTGSIALFFRVLQWSIYALIVVVPILFVYKILKGLYRRFGFNKGSKNKNNIETE